MQDTDVRAFRVQTDPTNRHEVAVRLAPVWPNQRMNYTKGDNAIVENNIRKALADEDKLERLDSNTENNLSNFQFTCKQGVKQVR